MINKTTKRGFTLIETLVAVLLLATALAGPLTIASKSLTTALVAKDQIIAFYLAQDAVEYVRFIRDSNQLAANPNWLAGLDGTTNPHTNGGSASPNCTSAVGTNTCSVDSINDTTATCNGAVCGPILYDSGVNYFRSAGTVPPSYARTISISTISATEAKLMITVSWSDIAGQTRQITVYESLFNWI